jgi:hypothetical protein
MNVLGIDAGGAMDAVRLALAEAQGGARVPVPLV